MTLEHQVVPDLRTRCASCQQPVDPDEPVYAGADLARDDRDVVVLAHVRCPRDNEKHAFEGATHVGQTLYGMNPPTPSGGALWVCRCGIGFAGTTDASAKAVLARHLLTPELTPTRRHCPN